MHLQPVNLDQHTTAISHTQQISAATTASELDCGCKVIPITLIKDSSVILISRQPSITFTHEQPISRCRRWAWKKKKGCNLFSRISLLQRSELQVWKRLLSTFKAESAYTTPLTFSHSHSRSAEIAHPAAFPQCEGKILDFRSQSHTSAPCPHMHDRTCAPVTECSIVLW